MCGDSSGFLSILSCNCFVFEFMWNITIKSLIFHVVMYVISKQLLRMYRNKLALRLGWNSMARFNGEFESGLPQQRDMLRIKDLSLFILLCWKSEWQILISRTVVWTLKFLSPTNAPLNYTCKILKYTARLSHYCSYMFRPTCTIIREPMPNLAKVTVLWK